MDAPRANAAKRALRAMALSRNAKPKAAAPTFRETSQAHPRAPCAPNRRALALKSQPTDAPLNRLANSAERPEGPTSKKENKVGPSRLLRMRAV